MDKQMNWVLSNLPDSFNALAINIYGLRQKHLRYSKKMQLELSKYKNSIALDQELIREIQFKKLKKILEVSFKTEFYAERFKQLDFNLEDFKTLEDLKHFPILERSDIKENFSKMIVPGTHNKSIIRKSSGTTGEPIKILQPKKLAFDKAFASLYNFYAWYGISVLDKRVTLAGRYFGYKKQGIKFINFFENQLLLSSHSLNEESVQSYLKSIRKYKPVFMQAHPSAMFLLKELAENRNLRMPKVPIISYTGETLLEEDRKVLENWFSGKIYGQYGSGEHHLSSAECVYKSGYHVNPFFSYVESIKKDYGKEIISTSLDNNSMPLIRYRIGDSIEGIEYSKCKCGSTWPRLVGLSGRIDEFIETALGNKISPLVLRTSISSKFSDMPKYSLIQHKNNNDYTLLLYTKRDLNDFIKVKSFLLDLLGNTANIKIKNKNPEKIENNVKHRIVYKEN